MEIRKIEAMLQVANEKAEAERKEREEEKEAEKKEIKKINGHIVCWVKYI